MPLVLVGAGVFFATTTPFTMLTLSRRRAAATTDAQRSMPCRPRMDNEYRDPHSFIRFRFESARLVPLEPLHRRDSAALPTTNGQRIP